MLSGADPAGRRRADKRQAEVGIDAKRGNRVAARVDHQQEAVADGDDRIFRDQRVEAVVGAVEDAAEAAGCVLGDRDQRAVRAPAERGDGVAGSLVGCRIDGSGEALAVVATAGAEQRRGGSAHKQLPSHG